MITINSNDVCKQWGQILNQAEKKPQLIKYADHTLLLSDIRFLERLLVGYNFTADKFIEPDSSITLFLNELNLVENASTESQAKQSLAKSILEYAEDFYNDFSYWGSAPNLQSHIPYVFKALTIDDAAQISENIQIRDGNILSPPSPIHQNGC